VLSLHVAQSPGETRVALLQGRVPLEYYIHRPGAPDGYGAVHWARVVARVPAMAGAFVALADAEAFLPDTEGGAGVHVGDHVGVRVTRAAAGQKGPRVTARLSDEQRALATPGAVRLVYPGPTPLEELRAAYPDAAVADGPFPAPLEAELDALADVHFALPGGMRGSAVPTPALTAIDLDGGAGTAARGSKHATQFAANSAALPELARQIRLRNLSGAILIDCAGVPTRKRAALAPDLTAALAPDRLAPRLAGFTPLGFAEILRPRLRPPLHERLAGPHAAGLAALRAVRAEAAVHPGRRFLLQSAPGVVAALQADAPALSALAHAMPYPLTLRSDPTLAPGAWRIETIDG
jgi:Ribonuclease G/E